MAYDVFMHRYIINGSYYNVWSGENTENYINDDVIALLNPKYYLEDDQEEVAKTLSFEDYCSNLGGWHDGFTPELTRYLIRNMVLALHSKRRITSVLEEHRSEYDYVIFIRPDNFVLHFSLSLDKLTDSNIIIPKQDAYRGCNDRISLCKMEVALYYGYMGDQLLEYSRRQSINSEVYMSDMLTSKGIEIIKDNIIYGTVRYRDATSLPEQRWWSGVWGR